MHIVLCPCIEATDFKFISINVSEGTFRACCIHFCTFQVLCRSQPVTTKHGAAVSKHLHTSCAGAHILLSVPCPAWTAPRNTDA